MGLFAKRGSEGRADVWGGDGFGHVSSMLALRTRGRGSRGRWLYGPEAGYVELRNLGRCTFTRDNREQEELRAQQKRKIIQEETTTDPGWGGGGGWRPDGPLATDLGRELALCR